MKRWIVVTAALLTGCANNPPANKYAVVAPQGMAALHGKDVRVKASPTPDFIITSNADQATMTVGMLFGAIGGGIGAAIAMEHMKSAGHTVVTVHAIVDPTQLLVQRVEQLLLKANISVGESPYELDVATSNWALAKDDVVYGATLKVLDDRATPPTLLASGECHFRAKSEDTKLSADDLLANHAEKLKSILASAIDHCAHDFDEKLFE